LRELRRIAVDIRHPRQTAHMLALSDSQLRTIWNAADGLPAQKRGIYLERMIAWLQFRGGRFVDRDLDDAVRLALRGLIHESAA
jgi:hypothetical protein